MAFDKTKWAKLSSSLNNSVPKIWGYLSATDSLATISAAAYFDSVGDELNIDDMINIKGSDGFNLYRYQGTGNPLGAISGGRKYASTTVEVGNTGSTLDFRVYFPALRDSVITAFGMVPQQDGTFSPAQGILLNLEINLVVPTNGTIVTSEVFPAGSTFNREPTGGNVASAGDSLSVHVESDVSLAPLTGLIFVEYEEI